MRIVISYFSGSLYKKIERINIPDGSSTNYLIQKIEEKL